jgi:hypothetical protein
MSGKRESCMSCFRGNKMPGCLTLEIRFLYVSPRCIYDKYRSGSVLSENPKDGDLRCTDMLTRSVVHDGIFYVLKRAVVISHNGLYG